MKTKYIAILISFLMLFGACEKDILEKTNPNVPSTSGFYTTPEEAEQAVIAAYSALQFFGTYNRYWNYTNSARSDESDFTDKQAGLPEVNGLDDFTMTSTIEAVIASWRDPYMGILKTNMVIENVPGISFTDQAQKDRIMGEAYFLRGIYHYILVRNFGEEIPMYNSVPVETEDFFPYSAEKGVINAQIISDFTTAKGLLPTVDTYRGTANIGRVSSGAACAFLGKIYLFQGMYQEAADEFSEIIGGTHGAYELVERFRDNHDETNENNMESIFEVQYKITLGDVWNMLWETESASEAQIIEQEMTMVDGVGGMWWNQQPSAVMIGEFETSDPRYYKTFWCPGGDTYLEDDIEKTYEQYIGSRAGNFGYRKWGRDFATAAHESDVNVRVMRLADVYLMYAECLIEGASGAGTPEQYINMIRDRARNIPDAGNYALSGSLPTVEELIASSPTINGRTINNITAALRHERMVELAFEGKRWDDINRWDIGVEICGSNFKPFLPIYQGDLDTNPNLKPNSSN